jgi:hypothetical protein
MAVTFAGSQEAEADGRCTLIDYAGTPSVHLEE